MSIIWIKELKKYVEFCDLCGEYIDNDGNCSNPFCPEIIN